MSLSAGSTLGFRYALEQRIGAGGYSEVWRAHDAVLDRQVAIKLLHTEHARHPQTLARFRTEAQLAGRLTHPNVARVYDFCDSGPADPPYLVMELIDGPSLAQVLAGGPLDPARSMHVIAQAAAGLHAAHSAGLVHRDIKPANIMLTRDGTVKITDFGISHTLSAAPVTGTGLLVGTPAYLAPERAAGERATPASDLYALGVLGYECISGAPPFAGAPLEVALAHRDRPLPPLPAATPAAVAAFIAELTAKDPAARPADASQVARRAAELRELLAPRAAGRDLGSLPATLIGEPLASPVRGPAAPVRAAFEPPTMVAPALSVPAGPAARRPRRRGGTIVGAIAVAASLAAVLAVLAAGSRPGQSASSQAARAVDVRAAALIGEPVRLAAAQLRNEGFRVRVVRLPTYKQLPGLVLTVRPAGMRPSGSLITVVAATLPGTGGDFGFGNGGHGDSGHGNANG
jgi:tRNA A-37 threonylcarbamoyl transferase component Bud32